MSISEQDTEVRHPQNNYISIIHDTDIMIIKKSSHIYIDIELTHLYESPLYMDERLINVCYQVISLNSCVMVFIWTILDNPGMENCCMS